MTAVMARVSEMLKVDDDVVDQQQPEPMPSMHDEEMPLAPQVEEMMTAGIEVVKHTLEASAQAA